MNKEEASRLNERSNPIPRLFLAPMAGVTDRVYRRLCFQNGCDGATTEMVSAQGYLTAPQERNAYRFLLARFPEEGPLAVQLFGSEPEYLAQAAARLTGSGAFTGIDINMGCPAQKVVGGQSGSALMKDPALAARIVARVKGSTFLPVTVKMRLGWDETHRNAVEFAKAMEDAGADGLTVHGRTRMQQYAGRADWAMIGEVKRAVRIPVLANGDIVDAASARAALAVTGCDGLAIGRGALGRPWIFNEIKAALLGSDYTPPSYAEMIEMALSQARDMAEWKGERSAVLEMRKFFGWYIAGRRGAARLRTQLNTAPTLAEAERLLRTLAREADRPDGVS